MASQIIPGELYNYTNDESLKLVLQSIKGNQQCKQQRKAFNLCRETPLGRHVDQEICLKQSLDFIDCFRKVQIDSETNPNFQKLFESTKAGNYSQELLNQYL
ncbi:hypothetical protein pb186bvf_019377 [Paramecium bursaria]